MKHRHSNRILSRTANHRKALLSNLSSELLEHGTIVTTKAKASELRKFFEPLVTYAKGDASLHRRRQLMSKVRRDGDVERLFTLAKKMEKRPGGYTRLTPLPPQRLDQAQMVRVELVED